MSFAVVPHEAWYVPCDERSTPEYAGLLRPLFEDETIAKIGQNIKFDLMVLRRIGLAVWGRRHRPRAVPLPAAHRGAGKGERRVHL